MNNEKNIGKLMANGQWLMVVLILCTIHCPLFTLAQSQSWPEPKPEARPYTRWWWLGSAVNETGLRYNLSEYRKAGIGGVEITPIYGVKGNGENEIPYLSSRWMKMLAYTEALGEELGMEINMATGTGWPFGGPEVPLDEAACKLNTDFTVGRTRQKVKRAAPGGEGYVIDHFDKMSVRHYLDRFDKAFSENGTPYPHTFFNDSYEVYNADWTPLFLSEFKTRRGYDLEQHKDAFLDDKAPDHKLLISDYRETIGELLLENFTTQWTDWAHSHGAVTRNQAHGSPANLIDIYAAVDIPECEGFGLSDFHIKGLRTDAGFTKKNDSDLSMLKYASSAAHISGKVFTSSETFTWLTEHFRTSLSQCKPDFDLMMVAGVNHVFFHGSCYSPENDAWPGWRFYASVDMTPANNWWSAMPAFSKYIERVQSMMQYGRPDNDILVYLPYYDMISEQPGRLLQFDIHSMGKKAPRFIESINSIISEGYDCDYISDKYLRQCEVKDGKCMIGGTAYSAIVIPDVHYMPTETLSHLLQLARHGARIVVRGNMPVSPPGFGRRGEQKKFTSLVRKLQKHIVSTFGCENEPMRQHGLSAIRRSNDEGYHYFISNLQGEDVDLWITLGRHADDALFFNPMNGEITRAALRNAGGRSFVRLQLASGESIILVTGSSSGEGRTDGVAPHPYLDKVKSVISDLHFSFAFTRVNDSIPSGVAAGKWKLTNGNMDWTRLGHSELTEIMATGRYQTSFNIPTFNEERIILDLGDVRETAKVTVNGREVATLFAVPYRLDITRYVHEGMNTLQVEVCNLPANRIAKLDRDGIVWRKFNEINVVDLNYKNTTYGSWSPMPSGLCSPVKIMVY